MPGDSGFRAPNPPRPASTELADGDRGDESRHEPDARPEQDADQKAADLGPRPHDRDKAAADWERSHTRGAPLDVLAREESRVAHDAATRERHSTAAGRSRATVQRLASAAGGDEVARVRDLTAAARDRTADARDAAMDAGDRAADVAETLAADAGTVDPANGSLKLLRRSAADIRRDAAAERRAAAVDRVAAAADRERAASDRRYAGLDELTGIFRRGTGELALTHEIGRSRRSGRPLVLAIIDVDGLKAVNDKQGHAAGDALLRDVAGAILSTMRSYDVTVRWGGDEFVCALSDVTIEVASERVAEIQNALEQRRPGSSISAGLAQLGEEDIVERLIARADEALYRAKTAREP